MNKLSIMKKVSVAIGAAVIANSAIAQDAITTNGNQKIPLAELTYRTTDASAPAVFYTSEISPDSLVRVYNALEWTPTGKVGVKISTGEPPRSNYLRPELIKKLVQGVNGTIVECNTAYGTARATAEPHKKVAEEHGFTAIAPVDILDEDGSLAIPVEGGIRLKEDYVGKNFANYGSYVVLSHFKGHQMAGFGGAIKNISIGFGSSMGKAWIHTGGKRKSGWDGVQSEFCEAMADAGKAVSDYMGKGKNIVYVSVMNRISIDCDCNGNPAEPDIHDIGVLASHDPVALDQACIDIVSKAKGNEALMYRIKDREGIHTLESAEKIGLGSRKYRLVDLGTPTPAKAETPAEK